MLNDDQTESFLTVAEVAELLKLNQQTIRNWIDQGSLPAVRVGRRVRIRRSDLDQILSSGYRAGAGQLGREGSPSADDFWSGEPVGIADLDPVSANQPPLLEASEEVTSGERDAGLERVAPAEQDPGRERVGLGHRDPGFG